MSDFDAISGASGKRTRSTQLRHHDRLANLIEREAMRVLDLQSRHTLTPEDARMFAAALDAPAAPTPRALESARDYGARVVHAD